MADRSADLLVIGGGVMGLWAARRGLEAGLSTVLATEGAIGVAGASANPLGALMPHAPERWSDLAAFQFEALVALEAEAARLEEETGLSVGYGGVGRIAPLGTAAAAAEAEAGSRAAEARWRAADGRRFRMRRRPALAGDPIRAEAAPEGVRVDDLTARIAPRAYLRALAASLAGRAEIREGAALLGWDGAARLSTGERIACGALVVAAGAASFGLLAALGGAPEKAGSLGGGVKGQAAVFELPAARRAALAAAPVLYDRGLYVVAHEDGSVAVGATTEARWRDPERPDGQAVDLARRAAALCPALSGLAPARLWAGLRPRTASRVPAVGRWAADGSAPIWVLTGGYKISLGVAHRAAAGLIERIVGRADPTALPEAFDPAAALAPRR